MSRRSGFAVLAVLAVGLCSWALWSGLHRPGGSWQYTSSPYLLRQVFASMQGPGEVKQDIQLGQGENELLWLTGYRASMVDESGQHPVGQEFMCHNSLFLDSTVEDYRHLLGTRAYGSPRVFTLAQGAYEITFPPGYAIPLPSRQRLQLQSQALNLLPEHVGQVVRHRIKSEFLSDNELWTKPKPLFLVEATGRVLLSDPNSASVGKELAATGRKRVDPDGKVWTGHWQVPPGVHTNVSRVTEEMALPFDTRAHYITSHLHPYAEWQELRDLTSDSLVYRVEARSTAAGRSLVEIPAYSSTEGLPLFADHEYQLTTHYNNTSQEPVTAMSIMFVYCFDQEFRGYDPSVAPRGGASPIRNFDEFCGPEAMATP